jgi:hypothetical protein
LTRHKIMIECLQVFLIPMLSLNIVLDDQDFYCCSFLVKS